MSVVSNLSFNAQNTGTFQVSDTAFKSGDSNSDREQGGNPYIPHYVEEDTRERGGNSYIPHYTEEDTYIFQHHPVYYPTKTTVRERLYNIDIQLVYALVFALVSMIFSQPLIDNWSFLLAGFVFVGYYVMSFFNFKNVADVVKRHRHQANDSQYYYPQQYYSQQEAISYY